MVTYKCCPCHQVILHQEGHMDDALTVSRSQTEESQAARMIYSTMGLFRQFIKYAESTFKIAFMYLQHCTV